ncbi:major pollen allergen Ole e 10 isoform X1 [Oryza sativa Japonica Group]|uniref:major pollen allergen Ole e 10 isoform X1 n=1 Tax=Oryza sativa subsp. japonica TaxID=39947 RepID=UPI0001C7BBFD|nr:major pollen allergen Ole e 10 isoform X1 [Oryza sativa Japonica Group]
MASATASLLTCFFALALFMLHSNAAAAAAAAPSLYHSQSSKTWCVANPAASEDALRANLEFACSESDCAAIQGTGGCSFPDDDGSLPTRASVTMNAYYQARGRNSWNCFFNGTGLITITDPSSGNCKYA